MKKNIFVFVVIISIVFFSVAYAGEPNPTLDSDIILDFACESEQDQIDWLVLGLRVLSIATLVFYAWLMYENRKEARS